MFGFGKSKNRKEPILLVDDNKQIADGLQKYFVHNGLLTETCHSAAALRERLAGTLPRAVVLDIDLGDGDGIDMIHEVKNAWPEVPVVMLTGMGYDDNLMQQAKEQHAQGYVSKTVPPDQLLATLLGILEHPERHL
jgi:two-component system response regulator HydG